MSVHRAASYRRTRCGRCCANGGAAYVCQTLLQMGVCCGCRTARGAVQAATGGHRPLRFYRARWREDKRSVALVWACMVSALATSLSINLAYQRRFAVTSFAAWQLCCLRLHIQLPATLRRHERRLRARMRQHRLKHDAFCRLARHTRARVPRQFGRLTPYFSFRFTRIYTYRVPHTPFSACQDICIFHSFSNAGPATALSSTAPRICCVRCLDAGFRRIVRSTPTTGAVGITLPATSSAMTRGGTACCLFAGALRHAFAVRATPTIYRPCLPTTHYPQHVTC